MNMREYSDRVAKLSAATAERFHEVFEGAIRELTEIREGHLAELAALSADFRGDGPARTVAEAEMDQMARPAERVAYYEHPVYQPRHDRR